MHNWNSKVPRVIHLFLLYFALGIIAAIGGMIFQAVEKEGEQEELDRKLAVIFSIKA